jgi:hypothetical protein
MALMKRGKTWHTHFFVDGQRFRQSLGTTDWREAQAREKKLIAQATQGILSASHQGFARLSFVQAAEHYFNGRKLELGEASQKKERQLLVKPCAYFHQNVSLRLRQKISCDSGNGEVRAAVARQSSTGKWVSSGAC